MIRLFIKVFVILVFISTSIYAQKRNLSFKSITVEDGLSDANIICMFQDSEGFMWFGTEDGLNKFDGTSFVTFSENLRTPYFIGNYVFDIVEDSDHDLWIATGTALNQYHHKTGTFTSYSSDKFDTEAISDGFVRSIIQDHNGLLWIGAQSGKLYVFNKKEKKISEFLSIKGISFNKDNKKITDLLEDHSGNIWVLYSDGSSIDIINDNRDFVTSINLANENPLNENPIFQRAVIEDRNHNIWVTTMGNGLFKIINENGHYNIKNYAHNPNDSQSLPGNNILSIFEDNADFGIWLGIENKGLSYFDPVKNKFQNFEAIKGNDQTLSNNSVWSIYKDNENGLWVGTYSTGINYSSPLIEQFHLIESNFFDEFSLSSGIVSCFLVDHTGALWVGTDGGGLNKQDQKTGKFTRYNTSNSGLSSNAILEIFEDSKNRLWIATWDGGINIFDQVKNTFKVYKSQNSNLTGNNFSTITEDKNGIIWIGGFWENDGICYFDEKENNFHCFSEEGSSIGDNTIYKILYGSDDNLWLATHNGLGKFNPNTQKFTFYRPNSNNSKSISHPNVHSVIESKSGLLWMATASGFNSFNRKTETFTQYLKKDFNFPEDNFTSIEEDSKGNLWISYKKGLLNFNLTKNEFKVYKASDGLQKGSFIRTSSYKSPNGEELYFGGTEGYNYFNLDEIHDTFQKPDIFFSNLKIFNKDINPGTVGSPLETCNVKYLDTLNLSYKHSVFTIEYGALNYTSPEKISFAYMLDGFENEWNYVGNRRSATYTNLDPGTYIFKVKIPNNKGVYNETGISLVINISPPFYLTWWFRLLSIFLIIGIILSIFYLRIKNINRRNSQLEQKVKERTKEINKQHDLLLKKSNELTEINTLLKLQSSELKMKSEQLIIQRDELSKVNELKDRLFSIISHDLRNPFNSLKGFTELLKENYHSYDDASKLNMIHYIKDASDNLFDLIEQLLDWSRAQGNSISFNPQKTNLISIILKNITIASSQAKLKNININFFPEELDITFNFDPDLILTVLRNLLSNAIKFTPKGGEIYVDVNLEFDKVIVSVKDSGVGISKDHIDNLFKKDSFIKELGTEKEKGTGLGLAICRDFVKIHKGEIWVESEEFKGATFSFSLPTN